MTSRDGASGSIGEFAPLTSGDVAGNSFPCRHGLSVDLEFDVFCAKVSNPNVVSHKAVDEEDGGIHPHDGRVLSIDGEIREAVILGLPMKPLCREACAGLCSRCGEDLNQGPCRCARAAAGG